MDPYKQHKETESKVHEGLYANLGLLSEFYPTTQEFDAVLRRDMFVKNNKAAFFQVVYYLLKILNPEVTKKRLATWPPYDLKEEAKFRSDVMAYINTFNSTYENADIPLCQASSLISPGGFRFAKFMLKLSQLVIYEHLKKSGEKGLLYHMKPHKNSSGLTNTQKNCLVKETRLIEKETDELLKDFNKNYLETNGTAKGIQNRLEQLNKDVPDSRKKLKEAQLEFNTKYPSYPSLPSLEEQVVALKQQTAEVVQLENLFSSSEKLLQSLSGSMMTLEHDEDTSTVPKSVAHIITNTKELDLSQFFQALALLLETSAPQFQSPIASCIQQTRQCIERLYTRDQVVLNQLQSEQEHINIILDRLADVRQGITSG